MWIVTDIRALARGILLCVLAAAVITVPGRLRAEWNRSRRNAADQGMEAVETVNTGPSQTEDEIPQIAAEVDQSSTTEPEDSGLIRKTPVVVIDAGHGGEDGGAVSPDGTPESGINLDIALRLGDLLRLLGQPVRFTRETDASLGDLSLPTVRQRKNDDIRKRVALVNGTGNAVLLSIHQNSLPSSPVTHGAQVFWNQQAGGETLAAAVQAALNHSVNTGNAKHARPMGEGVYLMSHAEAPAALVECGFLSNASDASLLRTPEYRARLALAIAEGVFSWRDEAE